RGLDSLYRADVSRRVVAQFGRPGCDRRSRGFPRAGVLTRAGELVSARRIRFFAVHASSQLVQASPTHEFLRRRMAARRGGSLVDQQCLGHTRVADARLARRSRNAAVKKLQPARTHSPRTRGYEPPFQETSLT